MAKNVADVIFDCVSFQGKPVLLAHERIDKGTLPQGVYCYDIRHSDSNFNKPATLENRVAVNFYGTIITKEPIPLPAEDYLQIKRGELVFRGAKQMRLADFLENPKKTIQEQLQAAKEALRDQPKQQKTAPARGVEGR